MNKDELKAKVCAAIDDYKDKIAAIADSIADEPELGFKEVKTSAKVAAFMRELGIDHTVKLAATSIQLLWIRKYLTQIARQNATAAKSGRYFLFHDFRRSFAGIE